MSPVSISRLLLVCLALHRLAVTVAVGTIGTGAGAGRERFRVVISPLICRRTCAKGRCHDTCEQVNNTTLVGENGRVTDTLTGRGFKVVVCPHMCMNGGVCTPHGPCLCPPGFTGRLCQFPLHQTHEAQSARGGQLPIYPLPSVPAGQNPRDQPGPPRPMTQTHSVFRLPLTPGTGSFRVRFPPSSLNVRVHHDPDTSVVIHPFDQSEAKPVLKPGPRPLPQTQKPRGRCFQETTPKQACSSNPLPGLTNQEDCCGSVGKSWGQNKCHKCPKLPDPGVHKLSIIEDYGSTCPQGYKRLNSTHCQDINECTMQGVCQNGECLNTQGSFRCACKPGYLLEWTRCVEQPGELGPCFRMVADGGECEHALPTMLSKEMCCCTVGKAWGSGCERCPQDGTASFSKICPAGKGYIVQSYRETLSFQPHTLEQGGPGCRSTDGPAGTFLARCLPYQQSLHARAQRQPVLSSSPAPGTDECRQNRNICGHGECINGLGGFSCHCYSGYRPHSQRKSCVDDNECELDPCGPGKGICINTAGSYRCHCNHGFQQQVLLGKLTCVDINECAKPHICGEGGHCVNLPGTYRCQCKEGYGSASQRQPVCEDIDECLDPNACPNEQCENTQGSYECVPCQPGHQARVDIDECQEQDICPNGRCENLQGTYRCLCNEGFVPEPNTLRVSFPDIDECEDDRLCANGHCVNTEGSFLCQCYPGYQPTQEGSHCEDTNECEKHNFCQRGHCINTMGSYRCECQKGFQLINGRRCQDIDECAEDRGLCQPGGVCENQQGTYVCVCGEGYVNSDDDHSCEKVEVDVEDKKECYLNLDDTVFCDSVLATNVTKQECCCSIGVGWGDQCEIFPCPVYSSAEFSSLCPSGRGFYYEHSMMAYGLPVHRDIDECVLFADEICKEGRCMNTQPGYECYCQQGFYYDSNLLECIDVDECHDKSLCTNGRCVNTRGSFYCVCNPPWTPDTSKKNCIPPEEQGDRTAAHKDICFLQVDEDLICSMPRNGHMVTYSECCCHYGRGWGPECRTCPQRNSGLDSSLYRDSSEEDSDECSCANGRCVRSYLGTMCECNPGFRLDHSRTRCQDVNECAELDLRKSCKNSRCVNTLGSYKCVCLAGFVPSRRPNLCIRPRAF
uniref:Latent transforming growth factor beta binding protein 3 n=1 Tax=Scleropages formosus TaxID=113540 RepID=A0A8C9TRW5_SCLFO